MSSQTACRNDLATRLSHYRKHIVIVATLYGRDSSNTHYVACEFRKGLKKTVMYNVHVVVNEQDSRLQHTMKDSTSNLL